MLVLLILIIVGVIARKTKLTDAVSNQKITKIVLNIAQTAVILDAVINVESRLNGLQLLGLVGISCLTYVILIALSFLVPRALFAKEEHRGLFSFMTIFGNVGFMGFPVIASIFGSEAVFYASMFNIPFGFLAYSMGIYLITGGTEKGKFDFKLLLLQPPLIATFLSVIILYTKVHIPVPIADAVSMLGDMIIPLAMIIIGGSLGDMKLKDVFSGWRGYMFSFIKLILVPIIVWSILRLFVKDQEILGIATVIAGMPVATIATMFSIEYGGNEKLSAKMQFVSTILSVVSIPFIVYLLLA
jgi:predicted permease